MYFKAKMFSLFGSILDIGDTEQKFPWLRQDQCVCQDVRHILTDYSYANTNRNYANVNVNTQTELRGEQAR